MPPALLVSATPVWHARAENCHLSACGRRYECLQSGPDRAYRPPKLSRCGSLFMLMSPCRKQARSFALGLTVSRSAEPGPVYPCRPALFRPPITKPTLRCKASAATVTIAFQFDRRRAQGQRSGAAIQRAQSGALVAVAAQVRQRVFTRMSTSNVPASALSMMRLASFSRADGARFGSIQGLPAAIMAAHALSNASQIARTSSGPNARPEAIRRIGTSPPRSCSPHLLSAPSS